MARPEGNLAPRIKANEMEDILADADTDRGKRRGGCRCGLHASAAGIHHGCTRKITLLEPNFYNYFKYLGYD
jgi:hypothetical protein